MVDYGGLFRFIREQHGPECTGAACVAWRRHLEEASRPDDDRAAHDADRVDQVGRRS